MKFMLNHLGWSSPSCSQFLSARSFKPTRQAMGDFQAGLVPGTNEHPLYPHCRGVSL